ncbi:unnamed protein product, partial [Eretmochelys imbricata]
MSCTGAVRGRGHPLRAADHATPSLHAPQVGWGEHHPGGPTGPPGGAALHPEPKRHAAVAPWHRPRALQLPPHPPELYSRELSHCLGVSLALAPPWDRELELLVYYTEPPKPSAVLEAGLPGAEPGLPDGRPGRDDDPAAQSARGGAGPEPAGEFVLLLGRSGSTACPMDAETCPASASTETLVLLLKSLPLGCYFNICGFGSEFESFYPQSVENTQQTKAESLQSLQLLQANLGGTEILEPLRAIYRSPCRDGHPRQLFVFTDGEVENTQDIIAEDPQVLLLRHRGWGLHGSDQRHCSGSRGQRRVHHRPGPCAAQGATVSEVGPAAGGDRDLTELGSAPWDPGGAAALGPRGDLCWAAVACLRPAPRAAP